ncbi:uroporphyrinogen-III C-methyltransferase [Pirellulaceae bacterium SH449]
MASENGVGKVYLVGAGPGDERLITVRGVECLAKADVVLYDGLINPKLLQYASPMAEQICVGKHGHGGMWKQKEIDNETVRHALQGKKVVRLKGGDTTVFARTAEEIERLIAEDIPFEVVPGITAALAVSAYTGIPLTHRDWASSVALVTGQLQPVDGDVLPEDSLDWQSLASFPGTLVIYMGMTTAGVWSQMLVEHGKPASTPVALVRRVSWSDQQLIKCTLGTVVQTLNQHRQFRSPSIAIIGEVVNAPNDNDWFASRPLNGLRFLVASPEPTASKLEGLLREEGAMVTLDPSIRISPPKTWGLVDEVLNRISEFHWVVFSSSNGVDQFMQRLWERNQDARSLAGCRIATVGDATAASLRRWGLASDCSPETGAMEQLIPLLTDECRGKKVLFVRTSTGKLFGMEALAEAGAEVTSVEVYVQASVESWSVKRNTELAGGRFHGIVVTSQNVAASAARLMGEFAKEQTWFCLSETIAEHLRQLGCTQVFFAKEISLIALVQEIKERMRSVPRSHA